jgi:peptidyl-prolyl cis-trans isomerase A (cyclophilin A)
MHTMTSCSIRKSSRLFLRVLLAALVLLGAASATRAQTQPAGAAVQNQPEYISLKTSHGEIVIELDPMHSPRSVANFLAYVDKNFYDGTIFHRVLAGSIIQGGGFTPDLQAKPVEAPIENEWKNGLKHKRGSVAMARTTGDANSATSQFFINVIDNRAYDQPQADGAGYAVFGMVIAGMKVVDDIRFVPVSPQANHEAVPAKPVVIESIERISKQDALAKAEADKPKRRRPPQPLPERPPQRQRRRRPPCRCPPATNRRRTCS